MTFTRICTKSIPVRDSFPDTDTNNPPATNRQHARIIYSKYFDDVDHVDHIYDERRQFANSRILRLRHIRAPSGPIPHIIDDDASTSKTCRIVTLYTTRWASVVRKPPPMTPHKVFRVCRTLSNVAARFEAAIRMAVVTLKTVRECRNRIHTFVSTHQRVTERKRAQLSGRC